MANEAAAAPRDAVYTWVDGSDPGFQRALQRALQRANPGRQSATAKADSGTHRFRDSGELRYSLRSLECHAPWIERVFLVTNGQRPSWLNTQARGLTLVDHQDIFADPSHLPTFNSHAIEACLHRIPGLGEAFIYFNDDLFLGRQTGPQHFCTDNGDINHAEGIHLDTELDPSNPTDQACAHTRKRAQEVYSEATLSYLPAHAPRLFRKSQLVLLEQTFGAEFRRTRSSRLRSPSDFVIRIAHAALLEHQGCPQQVLQSGSDDYQLIRLGPGVVPRWRELRGLLSQHPRMFCINDELNDSAGSRIVRGFMTRCLERLYPAPSRFEKPANP